MIRALLPVTFALTLAVVAGILLAQNGVFSGSDADPADFSPVSAGNSCCSKSYAQESQASLASADSGCCGSESGCTGGQCPSLATFASLTPESAGQACASGGCPLAAASAQMSSCPKGNKCSSGEAKTCCDQAGKECSAGAEKCGQEAGCSEGKDCCSDKKECCSKENGPIPSETSDAVAAVTE